jgi:hypothetical protein
MLLGGSLLVRPATKISQLAIDADKAWPAPGTLTHTPAWLYSGWKYRKKFTVTGSIDGAQANYQLKFRINNSPGIDSNGVLYGYTGGICYTNGGANNYFTDLRFVTAAGTLLNHWIESYSYGSYAEVIVNIDTIPASPGTVDFYLYWGNAHAANISSGPLTLDAFDNFESGALANWTERDPIACNWSAIAGAAKEGAYGCQGQMAAGGDGGLLTWNAATFENCCIEIWVRLPDADTLSNCQGGIVTAWLDNNNYYIMKLHDYSTTERVYIREITAGAGSDRNYTTFAISPTSWYRLKVYMAKVGANLLQWVYVDDTQYAYYSDATPRATPNSVGLWCANTNASRVWVDTFRVRKFTVDEPLVTVWDAEENYYNSPLYGVVNVVELAAGMVKGDILYHDGTNLVPITPGSIGTNFMTHDALNLPTWEYPP